MTTVFEGRKNFKGISGDYARVMVIENTVLIPAVDAVSERAATISMTPAQARALATGIAVAANEAEAHQ